MNEHELNRRDLMKAAIAGGAAGVASISVGSTAQAADADKPQVKVAGYDYDRVRAIMDGQAGSKVLTSVFTTRTSTPSMITRLALNRHTR